MASLLILTGARKGQSLALRQNRSVLGRDPACDVVIDEALLGDDPIGRRDSVSRRHAVITRSRRGLPHRGRRRPGAGSRNGTYVNDREVPFPNAAPLRDDDRIRICGFVCLFQDDAHDASSVEASIRHDSSSHVLANPDRRQAPGHPGDQQRPQHDPRHRRPAAPDRRAPAPPLRAGRPRLHPPARRGGRAAGPRASSRRAGPATRPTTASAPASSAAAWTRVEAILGNDLVGQFPDSESVWTCRSAR